jgi:hypothetical protein
MIHSFRWSPSGAIVLVMSIGCASLPSAAPQSSTESEFELRPGSFPGLEGTAFGEAVEFDNDIYSAKCYPLFAITGWSETAAGRRSTGSILLWVNRVHLVQGRVFVAPCEVAAPFVASASRVAGHVSDSWFEVTLIDQPDSRRVSLRRLSVRGWGPFSNPSFCGSHVAFWSLATGGELTAHVANLFDPRALMSTSFGIVKIDGSDMGWGVQPAAWTPACTVAAFRSSSGETRDSAAREAVERAA